MRLVESRDASGYSRCGRTDKGVSALGQVVAFKVRSAFPAHIETLPEHALDSVCVAEDGTATPVQQGSVTAAEQKKKGVKSYTELDYCGMLNRVLPAEIRSAYGAMYW